MYLEGKRTGACLEPLTIVTLQDVADGVVVVRDGMGREYLRLPARANLQFTVAGVLGYHTVTLEDEGGRVVETLTFRVDAQTALQDQGERFSELLQMLYYTMKHPTPSHAYNDLAVRYQGRIYHLFTNWLRYHVYALKGMKYLTEHLKDGIDLYHSNQRADGLIWDNVYHREQGEYSDYWDLIFAYDHFIQVVEDYHYEFRRQPVDSDTEAFFVEGLYYTWKAVGDDEWMAASLDAAIKALDYSINSPYYWSSKYQLIRRGYSIDCWDFTMGDDEEALGNTMVVHKDTTPFGIMFGDNTGYAATCRYLAEMLERVGRTEEASLYRQRGQEILERLNALAWNGHYYTHHIPEQPEKKRDLGVNEGSQLSLSNAFSLNRGIEHEKCVKIIQAYQQLREDLPEGSPGEWYTIYPPFPKHFSPMWQYMNGGVTPLVAGELALGAFAHGFEEYAGDILLRLYQLGKRYQDRFYGVYTGSLPKTPKRTFTPLDISSVANTDTSGKGRMGLPGWTGEGENDLHELPGGLQELAQIPFLIPDPETNAGRGCIGLSVRDRYARRVSLPVGEKAACIYFLHTCSQLAPSQVCGSITLHYADGSVFSQYVMRGLNVEGWWIPQKIDMLNPYRVMEIAWRGKNATCPNIALTAYGMNNPYPDLQIERITLTSADDGALWLILGLTLSQQPAYFEPGGVSHGIPDSAGVAPVVSALLEGLAGAVDSGVNYSQVTLAPRWLVVDVNQASAVVRYADSLGYVAYRYTHNREYATIELELTGSGDTCNCHILLPAQAQNVLSVRAGDEDLDFVCTQVEASRYVDFTVRLPGPHKMRISYSAG